MIPVGGLFTTYRVAPAGTASTYVQSVQMGLFRSDVDDEGTGVPLGNVARAEGFA